MSCKLFNLLISLLLLSANCNQGSEPASAQARSSQHHGEFNTSVKKRRRVTMPEMSWNELAGKKVVFITHPSLRVSRSFIQLVQNKLLNIPNVHLIGLFHQDEDESYRASFKLVHKRKIDFMSFKKLSCPLKIKDIFKENACTPVFKELVSHASGFIFTGGPDIAPYIYGEKTSLTTVIDALDRQEWEISLLAHLMGSSRNPHLKALLAQHPKLPVLGICMGMQAMNVATGGTLVQDIPSELYGIKTLEAMKKLPPDQIHRSADYYLEPAPDVWPGVFHHLKFTKALDFWRSLLPKKSRATLADVQVMSVHHQSVEKLGKGIEVIATSTDGKVVEAIRHTGFDNVLAVQFHPEYDVLWNPSIKARRRAGHAVNNYFAATLAKNKPIQIFLRSFWSKISARIAQLH